MQLLTNTFLALFPLYFYMATGAVLRKMKILKTEDLPKMNALLFRSFLFFSLFNNVRNANFSGADSGKLLLFGAASVFFLFAVYMLTVPRIIKNYEQSSVAIQAMYRSNFVLLGMAYAEQLCGPENVGPVSLLVSVVVPSFNLLAVLTFELLRGGKVNVGKIAEHHQESPHHRLGPGRDLRPLKDHLPRIYRQAHEGPGQRRHPLRHGAGGRVPDPQVHGQE